MTGEAGDDILYPKVLILPSYTTVVRDTLVADVGTIIYNSTSNKLNYCKTKSAGAGSWEAITSA
jgi:hypothetical protein